MTRPVDTTWDYPGLAYCGGLVGALLAIGHNLYTISSGSFDAAYPFRHVLIEAATSAGAGAVVAMVFGAIYRLLQQRM
jgi:hypothetical protein